MNQNFWKTILQLANQVSVFTEYVAFVCFEKNGIAPVHVNEIPKEIELGNWVYVSLNEENKKEGFGAVFSLDGILKIEVISNKIFSHEEISFLKLYLPYCFLSQLAKKRKRAVTIAHFAQSLDGKIATNSGASQWIGNEENLIHAHRMRALCDAIIIGKNTLVNDAPKLTVRRVEGENPMRVVIGSPKSDFSSLMDCCSDPILVIGKEASDQNGQIRYHCLNANEGKIESADILKCLYEQGLKTVFIEGGSITTSNFLNDKAIDILQLHFSPSIFGSGKQGIELPEIKRVDESIRFDQFSFVTVSDSIMFIGQPN